MRPALAKRLAAAREARRRAGLERRRRVFGDRTGPGAAVNFSSNDYLGLARHPEIAAAMAGAARIHGTGSGASALVTGHGRVHAELEARLAAFFGFEAAAVFVSGYQANLAVGQALLGRGRGLLADRLNHASLNDAGRLAGARIRRYAHRDAGDAARRLDTKTVLLASDGVFSMDGDLAPLADLVGLADQAGIGLWVDDAHGIGVLGETGRGLLEAGAIDPGRVDVFTATFGKALGTGGAFVAGARALIRELENTSRAMIYSTALSPALAGATVRALEILEQEAWRRRALVERIAQFRAGAASLPVGVADSETAIQPLILGDNRRTLAVSAALAGRGFAVSAIRPPSVPEGTARLRITLSAAHSAEQVDKLIEALADVLADVLAEGLAEGPPKARP